MFGKTEKSHTVSCNHNLPHVHVCEPCCGGLLHVLFDSVYHERPRISPPSATLWSHSPTFLTCMTKVIVLRQLCFQVETFSCLPFLRVKSKSFPLMESGSVLWNSLNISTQLLLSAHTPCSWAIQVLHFALRSSNVLFRF